MQTILPMPVSGQPSRGRPLITGRRAIFTDRSFFSPAVDSTSGVMSFTTRERSRSVPSSSMRPGFSLPFFPYRTSFMSLLLSPDVVCDGRDRAQLRRLFLRRERVTGFTRREPALRADGEALQRNVLCGFANAFLDGSGVLEHTALRREQSEHDARVGRH